ncbi:MAG: 23S rRNA (adenine(2030)-N(6))-methyltransferase RlmJ [Hyphomicrobiales bacterium]
MLSYQHGYHAGGPADVHKHAALAVLLEALTAKPRPITYMESHAGRGLYDLASPEARKTGEAGAGIVRLLASGGLAASHPYMRAIALCRAGHGDTAYPGSPMIAKLLLRPGDRLHLIELHPREHAALKRAVKGPDVGIHRRDGLEGLLAISPPRPRRGLAVIDPSYEVKSEFEAAGKTAVQMRRKWPEGSILVWYPLLEGAPHAGLLAQLETAGGPLWKSEIVFAPGRQRALGSGLACLNLPYGAKERLASCSGAPV